MTAVPPARRSATAAVALGGLVVTAVGLRLVGGRSTTVPLGTVDQLVLWVERTPAPVMAVALVRLAALVACAYLALVLLVWVVADAAGWRRLANVAAQALPATIRHAATGSARLGLAAGIVVGAASPVSAAAGSPPRDTPPPTATMWRLDGQPPEGPATATMVLLGPSGGAGGGASAPDDASATGPERPPMDRAAVRAGLDTWQVEAGDSFWSIAEAVLADGTSPRPVPDDEIGRYWARLVAANHDRLAAPDHPDLLIPGQILALPEPR